ncbi:phospholipase D-like domain-containing protein [Roseateles chitosanitabidus]|uniref:phospholipase D-like domain-containing protein n=1 Tax=Roseateles chitosanitabidus TaxID=65048 RepID=UPI00083659DB|nr:phospholipase D-like domain-containing protein [Roseateles chitosanitabidus]
MSAAAASTRARPSGRLGALLIGLGLSVALAACGTPRPPVNGRLPDPPAATPALTRVAAQVDVTGPRGPLDQNRREQALQGAASQGKAELLKRQIAAMSAFGDVDLYAGNDTRLLIDGPATFAAMFDAIGKARRQVLLESYIIEDADVSRQLADLLLQRRAQGVQVAIVYDAVGSLGTQDAYFDRMRQGGIAVCAFNPINPLKRTRYHRITHRDHRKMLIVDGETAFTGGINISAVYSSGSGGIGSRGPRKPARPDPQLADAPASAPASGPAPGAGDAAKEPDNGWRDTMIQVRGPAAQALHTLFRETWAQQQCEGPVAAATEVLPAARAPAGQQLMRVIPSTPNDPENRIYTLLLGSIRAAQRSVYLTMAYFAPGKDMVDALCDAASRGVDVQLILPSRSDFSPVMYAGRSHYERLLEAGVRIHELQDAVLHAKTAVIDGVVSTVGSSNMDWRSFVFNNEVNAVVLGEDFGDAMTRMFQRDVDASQAITLKRWQQRGLVQRGKEFFSRMFEQWW